MFNVVRSLLFFFVCLFHSMFFFFCRMCLCVCVCLQVMCELFFFSFSFICIFKRWMLCVFSFHAKHFFDSNLNAFPFHFFKIKFSPFSSFFDHHLHIYLMYRICTIYKLELRTTFKGISGMSVILSLTIRFDQILVGVKFEGGFF